MTQATVRPTVSVVILCYDFAGFIGECLDSVLDQRFDGSLQVLVGDDASKDGSLDIIRAYAERFPDIVKVISHARNVGSSQNYAELVDMADGEYIAYLDGDDLMLPGKLARQLQTLRAHPEIGLVAHDMRTVDALTKHPVPFWRQRIRPVLFDAGYIAEHQLFFYSSSVMFRACERKKFPVDLHLKVVGDFLNFIHILHGTRGCYISEELGLYRVNPSGVTSTIIRNPARREAAAADILYSLDRAQEIGVDANAVQRGRARYFLNSAVFYLEGRLYGEFRKYIDASMRAHKIEAKQTILHLLRRSPRTVHALFMLAKSLKSGTLFRHGAVTFPGRSSKNVR